MMKREKKRVKIMNQVDDEWNSDSVSQTTSTLAATTTNGMFVQLPIEVLSTILKYLESQNLVQLRPVNFVWRATTSRILIERRIFRLLFCPGYKKSNNNRSVMDDIVGLRGRHHDGERSVTDLKMLNRCLKNSERLGLSVADFPCARLEFQRVSLDSHHIQDFFKLYGPFIKMIDFYMCKTRSGPKNSLSRLLTQQAPNIDTLAISGIAFLSSTHSQSNSNNSVSNDVEEEKRILFPIIITKNNKKNDDDHHQNSTKQLCRLTTLKTGNLTHVVDNVDEPPVHDCDQHILEQILEQAINLRVYETKFCSHIPLLKLESMGKLHTIKKMEFSISQDNLDFCEKFAEAKLNLQIVSCKVLIPQQLLIQGLGNNYNELKEFLSRVATAITKILECSKESLVVIGGLGSLPLFLQKRIKLPRLDKIRNVLITNETKTVITPFNILDSSIPTIIPPGLGLLSTALPNVQELSLELCERGGEVMSLENFWSTFHPLDVHQPRGDDDMRWPSVTTLSIKYMPPNAVLPLSLFLTNLTKLVIDFSSYDDYDNTNNHESKTVYRDVYTHMKKLSSVILMHVNIKYMSDVLQVFSKFTNIKVKCEEYSFNVECEN